MSTTPTDQARVFYSRRARRGGGGDENCENPTTTETEEEEEAEQTTEPSTTTNGDDDDEGNGQEAEEVVHFQLGEHGRLEGTCQNDIDQQLQQHQQEGEDDLNYLTRLSGLSA
jgi:hypothetical protein